MNLERSLAALPLCVLAACDVFAPGEIEITSVDVVETTPLTRVLAVSLNHPAAVTIRYAADGGMVYEAGADSLSTRHEITLARLRAGATYGYTLRTEGREAKGSFTAGALPPYLRSFETALEATGVAPHGLTLLELNDRDDFSGAVVVDGEGHVVWYRSTQGALTGTTVRANGNFVLTDLEVGLLEVTPSGRVVATLPQDEARSIHHDVLETSVGTLLFLTTDSRDVDGETIVGDAIWEWEPGAATAVRRWSSFDHLDPAVDWGTRSVPSDWLHANALSIGPRGNYVVSFNFLNQIISLTPDYSEIEWRLGGVNATVAAAGVAAFSGQHTAAEIEEGVVLMFDNGRERLDPFSRALELRLEGDQATIVRDLRPNPANWSRAVSAAFRLEDGSTLVTYGLSAGVAGSTGPVEVFSVPPGGGDPAWHLRLPADVFSVYRASPLQTIAGERPVD